MAKISVIIPVYNSEPYLEKCLDSVCNQTFKDIEILCINDCSTDKSKEILEKYASADSRIRVFDNKTNLKAAGSRNVGLDNANGEYVYFIDSDDFIDTCYLSELYQKSISTCADIVMNTSIMTHAEGKIEKYNHPSMPELPPEGAFLTNEAAIDQSFCVIWMRLFKRELLEKNKIRFKKVNMTEDNVFHFMTHFVAKTIYAFDGEQYYHYINREDSVTGLVKINNERDYLTMKAYDIIYDFLYENDYLKKNKAKLFNVFSFYKVDTQQKFDLYKSYFQKAIDYLKEHSEQYNELEWFFAQTILDTESFEIYKAKYPASVAISFLKNKRVSK